MSNNNRPVCGSCFLKDCAVCDPDDNPECTNRGKLPGYPSSNVSTTTQRESHDATTTPNQPAYARQVATFPRPPPAGFAPRTSGVAGEPTVAAQAATRPAMPQGSTKSARTDPPYTPEQLQKYTDELYSKFQKHKANIQKSQQMSQSGAQGPAPRPSGTQATPSSLLADQSNANIDPALLAHGDTSAMSYPALDTEPVPSLPTQSERPARSRHRDPESDTSRSHPSTREPSREGRRTQGGNGGSAPGSRAHSRAGGSRDRESQGRSTSARAGGEMCRLVLEMDRVSLHEAPHGHRPASRTSTSDSYGSFDSERSFSSNSGTAKSTKVPKKGFLGKKAA